jgi:hypothetical protein
MICGTYPLVQWSRRAAGVRRQHVAVELRRDLVQRDQALPLGVGVRIVARVTGLGQRHPELLRHHPHRLGEAQTLVQLDELEDVAADAAAEAVEEAALAIDVEGRRLLVVERTQALVGAADAAQRHRLLDDLDDVGLEAQVVEEALGKERHQSFSSTTVTPPPPWFGGAPAARTTCGCSARNAVRARRSWPVP